MINYYICNYADYTDLPAILFNGATVGDERKSLDGARFIAWSTEPQATGSISWMNGTEQSYTHEEILTELQKPEWTTEED